MRAPCAASQQHQRLKRLWYAAMEAEERRANPPPPPPPAELAPPVNTTLAQWARQVLPAGMSLADLPPSLRPVGEGVDAERPLWGQGM